MNPISVYDVTGATWKPNTSASVNPVPADQYLSSSAPDGSLVALSVNTKEMAGGLISTDCPFIAGPYFGLDVEWIETIEDLVHKPRNEMDLKITFGGGKQANGSCEWHATKKAWQLDPTGSSWVDTTFTAAPVIGFNRFSSRFWSDGTKWSCTKLSLNGVSFTPGSQFQNVPMISTNWSSGLHPQLQMECSGVPWFLRTIYQRVWVMASTTSF